jgi:hypothetical protein
MKILLVLLILGFGILAVVYFAGGYGSFDPSEQGRQARKAIKPGMTWNKVVAKAGEPNEYQVIERKVSTIGGEEIEFFKPGARNKFNEKVLGDRVKENSLPHGFRFEYRFSQSVAFAVEFDGSGTMVGLVDLPTVADLLE